MLQKKDGQYQVYGNPVTESQTRAADKWKDMLAKKFKYDPNEKFNLSVEDHPYGHEIFGLKTIVRDGKGMPLNKENGVIVSTIRMGFGHYRIAMAGAAIAIIPPLIVFILGQRFFVESVASSGVKG